MKMRSTFHILVLLLALSSLLTGCSKGMEARQAEQESRFEVKMANLEQDIADMVGEAGCTEDASCQALAFGEKPCGGPWTYIVFSTEETDAEALEKAIDEYNQTEAEHNRENPDLVSDCLFVQRPQELRCSNNTCTSH